MSERSPWALSLYALAALLALFELAVLWQTLHPNVSPVYRAFYIDRTTTCLPQPVTGEYELGMQLDFRSGGNQTRELRPCGWEGPAGDGMHSIGERSRLRFGVATPQDLVLELELTGVTLNDPGERQIIVRAGDEAIGQAVVQPAETARFTFSVPASAVRNGFVDIALDFPNAVSPRPGMANIYWRSIKLVGARLSPA